MPNNGPKRFITKHRLWDDLPPLEFTEHNPPDWLVSETCKRGSTMCNKWFWEGHILHIPVGHTSYTDFHSITRIA